MSVLTNKRFGQPYGTEAEASAFLWPVATTAQLAAIADPINTDDKVQGKMVYNSTTGLVVVADAGTAAGTWSAVTDGLVDHTPS